MKKRISSPGSGEGDLVDLGLKSELNKNPQPWCPWQAGAGGYCTEFFQNLCFLFALTIGYYRPQEGLNKLGSC